MHKVFEQNVLSSKSGHLHLDGVDLVGLAKEYGTPLYVFSERRLKENVQEILSAFRNYHPKTSLHYASKCESTIANLQVILESGSDLEVNSGGELYKVLYAGAKGSQIVYNGVGKSVREIEYAITNEIKSINVDSEFELQRIVQAAKKLGKKANVTIRMVPEVSTGVVKGNETGTHESKFGITLDKIVEVFQYATNSSELNVKGYHFHIGTQTYDLQSFVAAFIVMLKTAIKVYNATGFKPETLNIGGGLPVPHHIDVTASQYMPKNIFFMLRGDLSTDEIAKAVTAELKPDKVAAWAGESYQDFFQNCELIVEAGRKVVADAAVLLSTVENKKTREMLDEYWITIDAGFNTLMEVKTYFWYYHMVCANKIDEGHAKDFKVAGPCCDSGDVYFDIDSHINLPDYRRLPESTEPGDIIAMLNVGAYGTPNMSNYNGRPKAGILLVQEDGTVSVSKPAEKYEDLVSTERPLKEMRK